MYSDETVKEGAKAVQETAKTARTFAELSGKASSFVSAIIDKPLAQFSGILEDEVRFYRYKNLCRIADKVEIIHRKRKLKGETIGIPMRVAIPMVESAALEDNESLQEIWARLIANSIDPQTETPAHPVFIDIVKQLSPDEAVILLNCAKLDRDEFFQLHYNTDQKKTTLQVTGKLEGFIFLGPHVPKVLELPLTKKTYLPIYTDNLMRLRVIGSTESMAFNAGLSSFYGIHLMRTAFGDSFMKCCIVEN